MPCFYTNKQMNYKLWYKCLDFIKSKMLSEGWNKHAKKFHEVSQRKATKLYLKEAGYVH